MKKIITLVFIMMTLGVNIVAAQKHTQKSLKFNSNVPLSIRSDKEIIANVIKYGNVELSIKEIPGTYHDFILWYIPKTESEMLYSQQDEKGVFMISYKASFQRNGERELAWWYMLWLIGLLTMRILQKVDSDNVVVNIWMFCITLFITIVVGAKVIFFTPLLLTTFGILFVVLFGISVATIFAIIFPDTFQDFANKKKVKTFFANLYYICIVSAMILIY